MLKINVRGENIEVTGSIREYVEKKLKKLEKYFEDTSSSMAHVNLKVYSDKNCKVEVTIPLPYLVLRAEETSPDMYASIDLVTDKLERQIRKYKTRLSRKSKNNKLAFNIATLEELEDDGEEDVIVKTKTINPKPMDMEEAIMQMELIGHTFFVYLDTESNKVSVVYKRDNGGYGLLETE